MLRQNASNIKQNRRPLVTAWRTLCERGRECRYRRELALADVRKTRPPDTSIGVKRRSDLPSPSSPVMPQQYTTLLDTPHVCRKPAESDVYVRPPTTAEGTLLSCVVLFPS